MTSNTALADELEAVNSIYDADTLTVTTSDDASTACVLSLPGLPFSFTITFSADYPDVPPQINGTQSTGPNTKKGDGESALNVLRDILGSIYTPGQVCLFDLIEEVTPLLQTSTSNLDHDAADTAPAHQASVSALHEATPAISEDADATSLSTTNQPPTTELSNLDITSLASSNISPNDPEPNWTLSTPLLVSKSNFIARALPVTSLTHAKSAISHLLSTNKKVASATHNITAWRIRSSPPHSQSNTDNANGPEIVIQDCDDNGETAAGGRLLHLMQLMDVWNCVVVVTRWYGGVKLGPDRFRCINMVARDALVKGGFARDEEKEGKGVKGKKGKKGG